jgi:hypothetical protein
VYLVDERSIFPADVLWDRAQATAALLAETASADAELRRHLGDAPLLARLDVDDAIDQTGQTHIAAAWRTAERAVAPRRVADRLRDAVAARQINIVEGNVEGARPDADSWRIELASGSAVTTKAVVNCLWESRALVDNRAGVSRDTAVTIRFKTGIFATGVSERRRLAPSTRIIGKFGDVTPYGNGDVYVSWYPASLMANSRGDRPPVVPVIADDQRMRREILAGLGLDETFSAPLLNGQAVVRGGYVVASGAGDISEPSSGLHERSDPDARELAPGYVSVDTGKYTLGPMLARKAAGLVLRRLGLR